MNPASGDLDLGVRRAGPGSRFRPGNDPRDNTGFTLVEILIGVVILMVAVMGLAASMTTAGRDMNAGRRDALLWSAVHQKNEELQAIGYASVSDGTEVVNGYDLSWSVQGANPKKLILVVAAGGRWGLTRPDTFVAYLMKDTP